jgi:hypothetical protein
MINEQLEGFFTSISEIECWDMEDSNCIEGVQAAISQASSGFYYIAAVVTVLFILLAALPKYSFKSTLFNDIIIRRVVFFLGLGVSVYLLSTAWNISLGLCSMREDSDVATQTFMDMASMAYYISLAIYPVVFVLVSVGFNYLLKRRKLMTIFRSHNKIFGLI